MDRVFGIWILRFLKYKKKLRKIKILKIVSKRKFVKKIEKNKKYIEEDWIWKNIIRKHKKKLLYIESKSIRVFCLLMKTIFLKMSIKWW